MAQIILDISSNTHKNDEAYYKRMVNELKAVDTGKHEIILKWQMWTHKMDGGNRVADFKLFKKMCQWAWLKHGYKTTSSVFDIESLSYLIGLKHDYELPFIKIANRRDLDWLIGEIPRKHMVYKSVGVEDEYSRTLFHPFNVTPLFCVSEYPAPIDKYPKRIKRLSDHTIGLDLWHREHPLVWEKHYKLSDSTGLDAGDFAITPEELREIL